MSLVCLPAEKLNELYNQLNGLRRSVCLNALDMNEYVVPIPVIEVEKIVYVDRFVDVSGAPVSVDISGSPEASTVVVPPVVESSVGVEIEEPEVDPEAPADVAPVRRKRELKKCFTDGQRIRHTIGTNSWIAAYSAEKNQIMYRERTWSLSAFVDAHYKIMRPFRTSKANAWKECECEVGETWISTYDLGM